MADQNKLRYNVAFVYTKKAEGYEGVRTWTTFESKAGFDKWYTDKVKAMQTVLEEDITEERAIQLTEQTPVSSYVGAAIQEASNPDGSINPELLKLELQNLALARMFEGH